MSSRLLFFVPLLLLVAAGPPPIPPGNGGTGVSLPPSADLRWLGNGTTGSGAISLSINPVLTSPTIMGGVISGLSTMGVTGAAAIIGASPSTSGASIFSVTNNTQPSPTNKLAFEVSAHASYDIPTFGGTIRPRIFETDLNVPTGVTSTTIHENFWSSNYLTGGGTSSVEINQFHAYFQNDLTGAVTGNVEGYESSALNNGVMGGYQDYLGLVS
jgi:hypothetical protein